MWPFLRDTNHFIALVQARQTGKTFNGMAKLLWIALRYPGSRILITAPKYEQARNVAFKALAEHLARMKSRDPELFQTVCGGSRRILHTVIRLRNGSTLLAQPPVPETIRGHTARAVYIMEANFISEDEELYPAVLFALNTTAGYLIAESTPWNKDSVFYGMMHDPAFSGFSRYKVPYTEAIAPKGPLNPEMITTVQVQLRGDSSRWRREMLCEWTEDADSWLPMSLIALCQDSAANYYMTEKRQSGLFYAGVDFGKKRDHSVIAVVEKKNNHVYLRLCHQFPLDIPYGAVIGYLKRLQDNWERLVSVHADQTGVGDYIVEDMKRSGVRNVAGVTFTETAKEAMATALKETMRTAECPACGWTGSLETLGGGWSTTCPKGCASGMNNPQTLRPLLHIPYDPGLFAELNAPTYELAKTGRIQFSHPEGAHDDRFWALALAVYASERDGEQSKPLAIM